MICCLLVTKYYSADQIKNNEMGGAYGTYGEEERCKESFGEGKRLFVRPSLRWEDNIGRVLQ